MEITIDDFGLEWENKDGEVHKADYDELIRVYEKKEEHDKEIRNKAIKEFAEAIKATLPITVHRDCSEVDYEVNYALYGLRHRIDRIAEQMKEVE